MRILHSYVGFLPATGFGGPVKVIDDFTQELSRRGHEVAVVCSNYDDRKRRLFDNGKVLNHKGVWVYYMASSSFGRSGLILSSHLLAWVRKNIHAWDLIHIHGYRNFFGLVLSRAARAASIPYVLQPHGSLPARWGRKRGKQLFDWLIGRRMLEGARKIIALTEQEAKQVWQFDLGQKDLAIIPNGFIPEMENPPPPGSFRQLIGISGSTHLVLYLGRLYSKKRIDILLHAMKLLPDQQAVLVIVGPDEGELKSLRTLAQSLNIAQRVHFVGPLYGRPKYEVLVDADVFILPTEDDPFPITVLEACWSGTPVVVTDSCGIAPLIVESHAGLVAPGQPDLLAEVISTVLDNDPLRRELVAGCQDLVAHLDISAICDMLEACYHEVVDTRPDTEKFLCANKDSVSD